MRRPLVIGGVGLVALIGGLVALAPASLVGARLAEVPGARIGGVEGTAWRGKAEAASVGPVDLGVARWRLELLPLLGGRSDLALETERMGRARLRRADGETWIEARRVVAPLGAPGLGTADVVVTDVAATLADDGSCRSARGAVTASPAGEASQTGELTGPLSCRDGRLVADLAGGPLRATWEADGRAGTWRLAARWTTADPATLNALAAKGFVRTPDGAEGVWTGLLRPPG